MKIEGVLDVFLCLSCGGVDGEWVGGLKGLEWCYFCVRCESGVICEPRYMCIVLGGYLHPVFNLVAPYGYLLPNMYLFIADIANPDSFV